ncbi:hypothetical protein AB0P36_34775 [Streptomyces flavidovirens]|uniref:hypothetical protein n=1 Tax=Streptomyces flavidovirens TaxID=67298 RepID=UPI0034356546
MLKAAVLGVVSAAMLVAGALPAQADQANGETPRGGRDKGVTHKVIPYVISDPKLIADPQKVVDELYRSGGSLDALGVSPATSSGPSKITRPERAAGEVRAAAEPESYVVDSSRFPNGEIPSDIYQYVTADECEAQGQTASRNQG